MSTSDQNDQKPPFPHRVVLMVCTIVGLVVVGAIFAILTWGQW